MKNHCFLRNPKIFLCLLIMFVSGGAHGQTNSLHELMEYLKPDTSIIRNYKDGVSIMYSRSPIYGKRFHYVKSGSTFVTSAVTKVTVTDMEILDDTVYFCGVNLSGNAVIGLSTTVTNAAFDMFPIGLQYDRIFIKTATTVESVAVRISAIICND